MGMITFAQKTKFSIKGFFSKCEQIRSFLKKSLIKNLTFCAVIELQAVTRKPLKWVRLHNVFLWDLL